MFFNFKNNNLNDEEIYCVYPYTFDRTYFKLLHLLFNDNIFLTFDERAVLYKKINDIIKFLEEKKK